jgi:hypothetical protein
MLLTSESPTSPVPLLVVRGSRLGLLEWHRPVLSFVPQTFDSRRGQNSSAGALHMCVPRSSAFTRPGLPREALVRASSDRLDIGDRCDRASTVSAAPSGVTAAVARLGACGSLAEAAARSANPGEIEIRPDTCPRPDHHGNSGASLAECVCALTGASAFRRRGTRSRGGRSRGAPTEVRQQRR